MLLITQKDIMLPKNNLHVIAQDTNCREGKDVRLLENLIVQHSVTSLGVAIQALYFRFCSLKTVSEFVIYIRLTLYN